MTPRILLDRLDALFSDAEPLAGRSDAERRAHLVRVRAYLQHDVLPQADIEDRNSSHGQLPARGGAQHAEHDTLGAALGQLDALSADGCAGQLDAVTGLLAGLHLLLARHLAREARMQGSDGAA